MKTRIFLPALRRSFVLLLLVVALPAPRLRAADGNPPERLTYQGFLADANGNPLGNTNTGPKNYDVIFRIWDAQTGGNELWAEQQTLTVDKGYFSVLLGEGSQYLSEPHPLLLSGLFTNNTASDRFVETIVKGIGTGSPPLDVTIAPRLRLLTSPYAFLARNAVNAANLANGGGAQVVTINSTNVGINNLTPNATLDVSGTVAATGFVGNGAGLTNVTAVTVTGAVPDAVLSTNIPKLNASQTWTGGNTFGNLNVNLGATGGGNLAIGNFQNDNSVWFFGWTATGSPNAVVFAGNSGGNLPNFSVLAANTLLKGKVMINANTPPTQALDVNGSIQLGTSVKVSAVGGDEANLKIVRGSVSGAGAIIAGSGFTVQKGTFALSTASFKITFTTPFTGRPTITGAAGPNGAPYSDIPDGLAIIRVSSANDWFECVPMSGTAVYWNNPFEFIAIGPR